jgi:hypothetical protein
MRKTMSFYKTYSTNDDLESGTGIDLDYGPSGTITIHRAGGSNKRFATVLNAKMAPYRRQLQNGTMDDAVANKIMAEVYADSVITGWKNVKGKDDKVMPFNKANVVKLLTDLPELFKDIQEQAATVSNFRKEDIEADAKNLAKS